MARSPSLKSSVHMSISEYQVHSLFTIIWWFSIASLCPKSLHHEESIKKSCLEDADKMNADLLWNKRLRFFLTHDKYAVCLQIHHAMTQVYHRLNHCQSQIIFNAFERLKLSLCDLENIANGVAQRTWRCLTKLIMRPQA